VEGGEQEYGRKPEPEVVLAAILAKKNEFLDSSWDFYCPLLWLRRSIFGPVSSLLMELNMQAKV